MKVSLSPLADDVTEAVYDEALRAALAARRKSQARTDAA
jgi:hypothetical protein